MEIMDGQLKETHGMNCEKITIAHDYNVWDIGGNPLIRKNWQLYFKNVPVTAIIYVVNISEDMERLKQSKHVFNMLVNEPALSACVIALVFNNKPVILKDGLGQYSMSSSKNSHKSD